MVDEQPIDGASQHAAGCGMNTAVGTIAAIHQPNYIPWLGYFFKIAHADKFVFLDNVAYPTGSFVSRNSIKTASGRAWLSVPVVTTGRYGQLINEVQTDHRQRWAVRHLATLRSNYGRAPYFREVFALLEPHYSVITCTAISLADFNIALICSISTYLGFGTQFMRASELKVSGHKTELLCNICNTIGATTYLAGTGAQSYQEDEKLEASGISPVYSPFSQQSYPQLFGEFVGNLSAVDALMNCGSFGTRRMLGLESQQG